MGFCKNEKKTKLGFSEPYKMWVVGHVIPRKIASSSPMHMSQNHLKLLKIEHKKETKK